MNFAYLDLGLVPELPEDLKYRLVEVRWTSEFVSPGRYQANISILWSGYIPRIRTFIDQNSADIVFAENKDGSGRDLLFDSENGFVCI